MAIYPSGQTFLHNVLCKLLLWPAAELSRAQWNTMAKNTWSKLSKLHLRNFGSDNIVRTSVCPLFHIRGCEMSHLLAGSARHILAVFNLPWTSILWPFDSCQKRYRWPVSHDCMAGSGMQLIELTYLLKLSADKKLLFNWSLAQVHSFRVEFSLRSGYGKSWITW